MSQYSAILGTGASLPRRAVSNQELTEFLASRGVETSAEWIETRTGIKQRYLCEADETNCQMASRAALQALKAAGVLPDQVDLIVLATSTPDQVFHPLPAQFKLKLAPKSHGFRYSGRV